MTTILLTVGERQYRHDVSDDAALGWRWWTPGGFAQDPVDPRPYGGQRGLGLGYLSGEGTSELYLLAMEQDGSLQVFTPHSIFPADNQEGAEPFARAMLQRHAEEPRLL